MERKKAKDEVRYAYQQSRPSREIECTVGRAERGFAMSKGNGVVASRGNLRPPSRRISTPDMISSANGVSHAGVSEEWRCSSPAMQEKLWKCMPVGRLIWRYEAVRSTNELGLWPLSHLSRNSTDRL